LVADDLCWFHGTTVNLFLLVIVELFHGKREDEWDEQAYLSVAGRQSYHPFSTSVSLTFLLSMAQEAS
jgi:hypothetical protein